MAQTYKFPKEFLWGTATSSFQIEGSNDKTDWWEWENDVNQKSRYPLEKSGIACDSYNRYEEDFDLCTQMSNNAVRISIEWARIVPDEGEINIAEIEHYKKVLKAAKDRNLKTFVTLLHFTLPNWIAKKGGWVNGKTIKYFAEYARLCAEQFGSLTDAFITINEPLVYTTMSYINGIWPPARSDLMLAITVENNLIRGHIRAYKAIKTVNSVYQVGMVENVGCFDYAPGIWAPVGWLVAKMLMFFNVDIHLLRIKRYSDFIGLNFYFTTRFNGLKTRNLDDVQSDLNWWVYPKGLEKVLLHLKYYKLPIYITENGIADAKDEKRADFIKNMLIHCYNAIAQGADVRGYFHWSLLDNYEWHQGFWPRFGLVEIDRANNLERKPRKSFYYYADICKNGRILE
jgi:beta-glucosidase